MVARIVYGLESALHGCDIAGKNGASIFSQLIFKPRKFIIGAASKVLRVLFLRIGKNVYGKMRSFNKSIKALGRFGETNGYQWGVDGYGREGTGGHAGGFAARQYSGHNGHAGGKTPQNAPKFVFAKIHDFILWQWNLISTKYCDARFQ